MTAIASWSAWWKKSQKRRQTSLRNLGSDVVESLEIRLLPSAATLGNVFNVPSRTIGEQVYTSIATDPNGNMTVVFSDNGLDSSGWGTYARRFAVDGTPLGNQFRINSTIPEDQYFPSIATNRDGKSLVVWRNQRFGGGDTYPIRLDFQFLNADGTLLGGNRNLIPEDNYFIDQWALLEGTIWDYSPKPWTFADATGQFWVVVPISVNGDPLYYGKEFQFWKVDPDGTPLNSFRTRLVDESNSRATVPIPLSVELGADGTFYVVYDIERNAAVPDVGQEFTSQLIVRRLSSSTGLPVGSDIVVHEATYYDDDYTRREHRLPLIIPESNGKFSVLYYNHVGDMVTQHYSANGTKLGSLIELIDHSELNPNYSLSPVSVRVLSNGNWLVAWDVPVAFGTDTSYAREFQSDGTPVGPAVELGTGRYLGPIQLITQPNDQFVVSWSDGGGSSGYGDVYARRLAISAAAVTNKLVIVQQSVSGTVGVPLGQAVKVAIEDQSGNVFGSAASTVTLTVNSGPGDFADGSTLSVAAVNGVATFNNLILDTAGSYTLLATADSLAMAISAPFDVTFAPVAPSVRLSGSTPVSTTTQRSVVIDGSATFTSALANLNLGHLTLSIAGAKKGDGIVLPKQGTIRLGSRSQVFVDNVAIGTKSGSAAKYKVTFNANATPDRIQTLIQSFSFTAAKKATVGTRNVQFLLIDGQGGTTTANKPIQVSK